MDLIEDFTQDLFRYLTHNSSDLKGCIIKKHSDNFDSHGDFSFPLNIKPWSHYLSLGKENELKCKNILDFTFSNSPQISEECIFNKLIEESRLWALKIEKCHIAGQRLYIFLDRAYAIQQYFKNQPKLDEHFTLKSKNINVLISQDQCTEESLSTSRLFYLINVSKKLLRINGCSIDGSEIKSRKLHFTTKAAKKHSEDCLDVYCATVLNEKTGMKESQVTSSEYFRKRVLDMQLIAEHKYGLRIKNEERWKIFLEQIGQAAVIFDLLQNKPSHALSLNLIDGASGNNKGVAFVLYNGARLSRMLKIHQENVDSGLYPPLPAVEEIDFKLINDSDEWILMFNFMMGYSNLLKKCVNLSSKDCPLCPHQLCTYLSGLTGRFSMYYRRIRILLEPRKHLVPLVEARIHFLWALQNIIHHCLSILDIKPVTQM